MISEERLVYLESLANQDKDIEYLCTEVRRLRSINEDLQEQNSRRRRENQALINQVSELGARVAELEGAARPSINHKTE